MHANSENTIYFWTAKIRCVVHVLVHVNTSTGSAGRCMGKDARKAFLTFSLNLSTAVFEYMRKFAWML